MSSAQSNTCTVRIEYCSSCGYRANAEDLSDMIKEKLGDRIHEIVLAAGRPSSFEVTFNAGASDVLLHSKLDQSKMPKFDAICAQLHKELQAANIEPASDSKSGVAAASSTVHDTAHAGDVELGEIKEAGTNADKPAASKRGNASRTISAKERKALLPRQSAHWSPLYLRWPLFWFPHNVNVYTARFTGLFAFIGCILVCTNADERWAWVMTTCILVDYLLRFTFGGRAAVLSTAAAVCSQFFPVRLTPGPPKQFAALCGAMFSGAALVAFWSSEGADSSKIAAIVFMAMLAGATGLESFLDFCLGCFFFKLMVKIGIIKDPSVRCDGIAGEMKRATEWHDERTPNLQAPEVIVASCGKVDATGSDAVPVTYKAKSEEYRREDFHLIRFVHIIDFTSCMGITALAVVFKVAEQTNLTNRTTWIALGIFASIWSGIFIILYLLKMVFYPRKVHSEWACPLRRNFFSAVPLTILLFSLLFQGELQEASTVLFWIGAPLQFVLSSVSVARWIRGNIYRDHLSPAWMLPVVGNLVAALAAANARESGEYSQSAYLWFSSGLVFFFVLLAITVARFSTGSFVAPEMRVTAWFYVAAPFLICSSYLIMTGANKMDFFALNFYYLGLGFLCAMAWLILYSYFFRDSFSMTYWGYLFPLCTVALASLQFYQLDGSDFSHFMAVVSLGVISFATATLVANTVLGFQLRRGVFRPEDKWSPMAFMKLTHYACREAIESIQGTAKKLASAKDEAARATLLQSLTKQYMALRIVHDEHSRHEEHIVFPALQLSNPSAGISAHDEHEAQHRIFADMDLLLQQLVPGLNDATVLREYLPSGAGQAQPAAAGEVKATDEQLAEVQRLLTTILTDFVHHLDQEELHVTPMARQYISTQEAVDLLREVWKITSPARWRLILPFVVRNQFVHGRRSRFLQCFVWALPERAQTIGQMVFQGVDELTWDRLVADVPEIIPRGVVGYERYF